MIFGVITRKVKIMARIFLDKLSWKIFEYTIYYDKLDDWTVYDMLSLVVDLDIF